MADNRDLAALTGECAADDISSVYYQRVKLTLGADGVNDGDVSSSNPIPIASASGFGTVGDGRKTVTTAGTAEQFSSQACKKVVITAETSNTNIVVIGGSGVVASEGTRQGHPLNPYQSVTFEVSNLDLLYIDSITDGEGVTFIYFS